MTRQATSMQAPRIAGLRMVEERKGGGIFHNSSTHNSNRPSGKILQNFQRPRPASYAAIQEKLRNPEVNYSRYI
ncbi:Uncharacterized protein TCM_006697 [Theobroma cacao]|uniref:Uncharacterized protein n=1 Tax=Theobroma cacao TaxID=3641 RepID=A0A061DYC9_THECC|nr:Uncharacterized protein TCM_006697 [Theobroma cacao]